MIDVAIIGCGPTGALLANLLGGRGVKVAVLEKWPELYALPRAVHFDGEAMRIFQSAGLADKILPLTRLNPGMLFKDTAGQTLVDWSRDTRIGPMGWHESYRFHQPDLEAVLRDGFKRFANVSFASGVRVDSVAQGNDSVTLFTSTGPIEARYAVVCDGADSALRPQIGSDLEDLGFQERWLVVDLLLQRDRPDLGDFSIQFCDPDAPATYVRGVGDRRRWEMRISVEDPDTFDPDDIWARLARWISPADASLERAAVYTFRSRIATRWREGRVMLAGDAAHQMPPFMGQGMCAGLRDAANLAWKLAAVCKGLAPDILSTYQSERDANARAFVEQSVKLGLLINQTAKGEQPRGKLQSIWPVLGPGLGKRDGVAGALVPQIDRADDIAANGFYALVLEATGLGIPEVVDKSGWLAARNLLGVIVRPDAYALAAAPDRETLHSFFDTFDDIINTVPPRVA